MNVWRIHLKADSQEGSDQRKLCLEDKRIVGVGWPIEYKNIPVTWDEYWETAKEIYVDSAYYGWSTALEAMKNHIQVDDLIWTRGWHGNYFLGRIISEWYYETSETCAKADIVNVRKCDWHEIGTVESVPGKVVSCFVPPLTVQRIKDATINEFSKRTYNKKVGYEFYKVDNSGERDIFALLSTDGCEDALGIYLQVMHDYLIVPSSCKKYTMAYEFVLKHRDTGKNAVVQVKTGGISLNRDGYPDLDPDTNIFLFATSGQYYGEPKANVKTISPEEIRKFLYEQTHLLPSKMKEWIELTR